MNYTPEQLEAMQKAAPDMLEALESIIATWDGPLYRHEMAPNIDKARAAIAKAKGESK